MVPTRRRSKAKTLSVFYGVPAFAWIPTHNQNHHRYLNGPGDAARTERAGPAGFTSLARYSLAAGVWQLPLILAYLNKLYRRDPKGLMVPTLQLLAILGSHLALATWAIGLHGLKRGFVAYAFGFGVPVLLGAPLLQATNYLQHVGCDASSQDHHSRNFTSPFFNWLFFGNGYHTVHHEHPGTHWSRYRALHVARQDQIDAALNLSTPLHLALPRARLRREWSDSAFAGVRRG